MYFPIESKVQVGDKLTVNEQVMFNDRYDKPEFVETVKE